MGGQGLNIDYNLFWKVWSAFAIDNSDLPDLTQAAEEFWLSSQDWAQRRRRPDTVLAACNRSAQGVMGAASAIEFPTGEIIQVACQVRGDVSLFSAEVAALHITLGQIPSSVEAVIQTDSMK
eukprot:956250-Rhodomonas_salina.1